MAARRRLTAGGRALRLALDLLRAGPLGLSLPEVRAGLGTSRSSAYRALDTLRAAGWPLRVQLCSTGQQGGTRALYWLDLDSVTPQPKKAAK